MVSNDNGGFSEQSAAFVAASREIGTACLSQNELDELGRFGDGWLAANIEMVGSLPDGTVVMVDANSGGHIVAMDYASARRAFRAKFGTTALAHVHRVGEVPTAGGAWWLQK